MSHEDFQAELAVLAKRYGTPTRVDFIFEMNPEEFQLVIQSTLQGRYHDVTLFIRHNDKYVVIEKHMYAKTGILRAPSGGASLGETLEEAAHREGKEETGLEIKLERFVLESHVTFLCEGHFPINWVSYVFSAHSIGGELGTQDPTEISDVQLRTQDELQNEIRPLLLASKSGGFKYRAGLTDAFFAALEARTD
ncbi:MAG: NUDIX hydrolase [Promethearchaeota archaeon]